jgi:hypothetical protein
MPGFMENMVKILVRVVVVVVVVVYNNIHTTQQL